MTTPAYRPAYPLLTPLLESWRWIAALVLVVGAATFMIRYALVDRRYEARATLMTVSTTRSMSSAGGLAAISMLAGQQMGNTPPELVARVLVARHVLTEVGLSPVDQGGTVRVVDRVLREDRAEVPVSQVERALSRVLSVTIERETGLIDVAARSHDSALARLLVTRVVEVGGHAFTEVMRAQASAQRVGQEARVNQMAEQLRAAELRRLEFARTHRSVTPFSAAAVEQAEADRNVELARQAYAEAVSARETAYARELEQVPAVVIVDPVPSGLPTVPRYNLFFAIAFGLFAGFVFTTLLLIREGVASLGAADDPRARRFLQALQRVPLVGRIAALR